jgi:hypothetical protein
MDLVTGRQMTTARSVPIPRKRTWDVITTVDNSQTSMGATR